MGPPAARTERAPRAADSRLLRFRLAARGALLRRFACRRFAARRFAARRLATRRGLARLLRRLLLRHLAAGAPRLGQPDRDRLLAALHLLARAAALQLAALHLVHRLLDLLAGLL